jgi:filamentous hemagglutinin family protein
LNSVVNFIQPNTSSAILNRVTGGTASTIAGQINGNGQVFLVNSNGIAITPSGSVNVGGGFVASTLDIGNADFNAGRLNFFGQNPAAPVSNAGNITAGIGGFVALLGGSVSNAGKIAVPLGKVGLGSGQQATIDPTGDGFLQVAIPAGAVAADGSALVNVAGRIKTDGGAIEIKTATALQAVRDVINISGTLSARSVSGHNGSIVLDGGAGGNTIVSGKLSAVGGKHAKGGSITVTGQTVELRGALIDASGGTGGGSILIGTDAGRVQRATATTVDQSSVLKADSTIEGNGGNVLVWADAATSFAGHISARGGPLGGNGGQAEVSGKSQLTLGNYGNKPLADLSAPKGNAGTLLFDPGTVNIVDQASLAGNVALNGPDTFTAQFISGQLATANVTIDTNNATGANGAAGDINLLSNASIAWSSNSLLTLNAAHNINFALGSSIAGSGAGAGLTLRADTGGTGSGTINFASGIQVNLPLGNVNLYYNPASNQTPANGGTNSAAGTVNSTSYTGATAAENWSSFVSAGTLTPWMLVNNINDLQNVNNNLAANYAVGTNINATATSGWNLGAGFVPLGTNGAGLVQGSGFAGNFDGMGHVISNLSINRTLASDVGLFGFLSGSVKNVGLANASVAGAGDVGGLVGVNSGSITGSFSTGVVSGLLATVGGLVGWNQTGGNISNSYAVDTTLALVSTVGGFVGLNDGSVSTSYAAGPTGTLLFSGGFAGSNAGSISQSYFDNQTTGQLLGVGLGNSSGVTGLATAVLQNGTLPTGFSPAVWAAISGQYPQLNWQLPSSSPPTSAVLITATDPSSGSPVYGNNPSFTYKVTDSLGNVLCTFNCSTYFAGTPVIGSSISSSSAAGTSATAYIAQGTTIANGGYQLQFINETLTVAPRPLTITASDQTKTYGSAAALGTTAFTTSGLVNGDSVSGVTLASAGANSAATVLGGPYPITASFALGTGLSNYAIGYASGLMFVQPAPVNVKALGGASTVGSSPANPGLSATGLQNGQSVNVLTGLSNSFGIGNTTTAGNYILSVAGSLTNPNYVLAGTSTGSWVVMPLRGSLGDGGSPTPSGTSPVAPSQLVNTTQNGSNSQTLIGDLSVAVNTNAAGKIGSASGPAAPRNSGGAGTFAPSLTPAGPVNHPASSPDAMPRMASVEAPTSVPRDNPTDGSGSSLAATPACPPKPGTSADSKNSSRSDREPCEAGIAGHGLDFSLSKLNRNALSRAIDRELAEVRNSPGPTLVKLAAATTAVFAAGFVSWLLSGGFWLGAFFSSMPLWRGLDPLVVIARGKPGGKGVRSFSDVDIIFANARKSSLSSSTPRI